MNNYEFSSEADADLLAILQEIARRRPRTAQKVKRRIEKALELLAEMPTLGHQHRNIRRSDLRVWPVHRYVIVYLPDTRPLQVIRILHGHRNFKRIDFS